MRILLVKISSLGDVVHNLPVASDIAASIPGAEIHWTVEESFSQLPQLHPAVRDTIPVAVRRWRSAPWRGETHAEVRAFIRRLRSTQYDAIIDTQGLLKSALIARLARGRRYGRDWRASREPLFMFYDQTFSAPRTQPAVERNRQLAAQALGYGIDCPVDYGIRSDHRAYPWLPAFPYAVLIHSTSADAKLWPEVRWIELGQALAMQGCASILLWGSPAERARSERLAASIRGAVVPPRLDLADLAALIAGAGCAIGVDTGITHLAGALGRPTIGIYTATHIARYGLYGCPRARNVGGMGASPTVEEVARALRDIAE